MGREERRGEKGKWGERGGEGRTEEEKGKGGERREKEGKGKGRMRGGKGSERESRRAKFSSTWAKFPTEMLPHHVSQFPKRLVIPLADTRDPDLPPPRQIPYCGLEIRAFFLE